MAKELLNPASSLPLEAGAFSRNSLLTNLSISVQAFSNLSRTCNP